MKLPRMLELTQELVSAYGPCGQEADVRNIVERELQAICDEVWVDEGENAIGLIRGTNKQKPVGRVQPPVVRVMAHLDELSMYVKRIEADGRLRVRPLGGIQPWSMGLGPIEILGDKQTLPGVLSIGPLHVSAESSQTWASKTQGGGQGVEWRSVHVFTRRSKRELEAAGVHAGTRVVVARSRRELLELGDCIGGYFLDDRVCLTIMLAGASLLRAKAKRPPHDVYLVATSSEEIGGGMAAYAAKKLPGTITLAVDVGPVAAEYGTELDDRPIVVFRDDRSLYSKPVSDALMRAGNKAKLKPRAATWESYGSDASFSKTVGHAPHAGLLCIPTDNTHAYEVVTRRGIENCAKLLAAYLERPL
ncbi:MAG: M20/M25/M40 family metallo-hydrolase [Planctomycetota bacterium]|nr:M20/M25/M40 family metallo-hydrolase [Planctomycetota bacterium]